MLHARLEPAVLSSGRLRYKVGAPIGLADFLALPPFEGVRYDRDGEGRLLVMSPDRQRTHRLPLARLFKWLLRRTPDHWVVVQEPAVALPSIYDLDGGRVGESFLGPKAVVPDLACFERGPRHVEGPGGQDWCSTDGLRLVVEVLSRKTAREDLGQGRGERVDRWRSYLASRIPEYWVVNATPGLALPPRTGLFLARSRGSWRPLPSREGRGAIGPHGVRALASGRVLSRALGSEIALEELFSAIGL